MIRIALAAAMSQIKTLAVACTMLALGSPSALHAQILKCIASDGRIEFATRCPPGTTKQDTGLATHLTKPAKSDAPRAKSAAELELEFQKRQADLRDDETRARKAQEALAADEARKRLCADARQDIEAIKTGRRIYSTDPKTGDRVYLTPEEISRTNEEARKYLQSKCG